MQYLDLNFHDRDEYEGKYVECNGCTYVVGEFLGVGAERVVHTLINRQSGLSFLVIKVLKQPRPRGLYTRTIAKMRRQPDLARVIPITIEVEVRGGLVELQPYTGKPTHDDRAIDEIEAGFAALERSVPALESARDRFMAALEVNAYHTEALYGLAHTLWRLGAPFDALKHITGAVEIEPNLLRYRRSHIELALATQQLGWARALFNKAERDFPDMHDLDEIGVQLLLDAGDPDEALNRVPTAIISDEVRGKLRSEVEKASNARRQALSLMLDARNLVMARKWKAACEALLSAQGIYNRDPTLCMNTAFAAIHGGDPRVCAGLMMYASTVVSDSLAATCTANAGFALLLADELDQAINVLDMTASRLTAMYGAVPNTPDYLPGVGVWIADDGLREERIAGAADMLERGLQRAQAVGVTVPDDVRTLVAAYQVAAAAA